MKNLLALLGILLMGTTLIAEAQAQSRRDDILRRRDGAGASRDRSRGNNNGGRVDRGRGNNNGGRVDRGRGNNNGGRVVRDRDNGRRQPDVVRDRRNDDRRRPDVGRDRRNDDRRRPDVGRDRTPDRRPDVGRDSRRPNRDLRHRPGWNNPGRRYTRNNHVPRRGNVRHNRRFQRRYDYHRTIPYRFVYNNRWIRFRVNFGNGYTSIDGYPYYVYNGYRHRYSTYDTCDYELVDGYDNSVDRTFFGYTCAQSYDYCAQLRDDLNYGRGSYRFFCSEKIEFNNGRNRYDHWDYEDDFHYDVY